MLLKVENTKSKTKMIEEDAIDECVLCRTKQRTAQNLDDHEFKVNSVPGCGHKFCPSCLKREFYTKRQFACPKCKLMVSMNKLSVRSLDETLAEKDASIRKRIKSIFNMSEKDFVNEKEWRDYEEMVEDIIYNLVHSIELEKTNEKIEKYRHDNKQMITLNQLRMKESIAQEYEAIRNMEEMSKLQQQQYEEQLINDYQAKKDIKKRNNQILLGEATSIATLPTVDNKAETSGFFSSNMNSNTSTNIHPLLILLGQRADPKPTMKKISKDAIRSKEGVRKQHAAGGYDYSIYDHRNRDEIKSYA